MVRKHHGSPPSLSTNDIHGSFSNQRPEYVRTVAATSPTMPTYSRHFWLKCYLLFAFPRAILVMAHSLANTGAEDGVPSSEGVEAIDAVDRADRKRTYGTVRVPGNKIGFWPGNRGGTGINSRHVHEIARDIMFRKCRRTRYEPVHLLEVPEQKLKRFKAQNKEKCDSDPLMPAFSPDMEYVPAAKTHFTHACKLAIDGTHTFIQPSCNAEISFQVG